MVSAFQEKTDQTGYSGLAFPKEPYATDDKKNRFDPKATLASLFLTAGSLYYTMPDAMPTLYFKGYTHRHVHTKKDTNLYVQTHETTSDVVVCRTLVLDRPKRSRK